MVLGKPVAERGNEAGEQETRPERCDHLPQLPPRTRETRHHRRDSCFREQSARPRVAAPSAGFFPSLVTYWPAFSPGHPVPCPFGSGCNALPGSWGPSPGHWDRCALTQPAGLAHAGIWPVPTEQEPPLGPLSRKLGKQPTPTGACSRLSR